MKLRIIESPGLVCKDCGYRFDIPDRDTMCPKCYSDNIEPYQEPYKEPHKEPEKKKPKQDLTVDKSSPKLFHGKSKTISYSSRLKKPIDDCVCYGIYLRKSWSEGYFAGYKEHNLILTVDDKATFFYSVAEARSKINNANWDLFNPQIIKFCIRDNHVATVSVDIHESVVGKEKPIMVRRLNESNKVTIPADWSKEEKATLKAILEVLEDLFTSEAWENMTAEQQKKAALAFAEEFLKAGKKYADTDTTNESLLRESDWPFKDKLDWSITIALRHLADVKTAIEQGKTSYALRRLDAAQEVLRNTLDDISDEFFKYEEG